MDDFRLWDRMAHLLEEEFLLFSVQRKREQRKRKKSYIYCDLGNRELNKFDQYFDFSDKSRNQH